MPKVELQACSLQPPMRTTNLQPKPKPRYLLERLDKLDDPILMETWKDIVETWIALLKLTSTVYYHTIPPNR